VARVALTVLGDGMDENLDIDHATLNQIRFLSDRDLVKLITAINDYGWVKAQETLKGLVEARGADRRI
jgi:hypothetical protein